MFDRFVQRARLIMQRADEQAALHGNSHVTAEHILLGVIIESEGIAAFAIRNLGPTLEAARIEIEKLIPQEGKNLPMSDIPLATSGKSVIEYTKQESQALGHNYIGSEHILLGLLHESDSIPYKVLDSFGINLENAREEVVRLLGGR